MPRGQWSTCDRRSVMLGTGEMENVSVSKGVFAHNGVRRIGDGRRGGRPEGFSTEPWYLAFKENWSFVQNAIERNRGEMFRQIITDVETFVARVKRSSLESLAGEIQTAILLTGVNVLDNNGLFDNLLSKLASVTHRHAVLWPRECASLNTIIEETVHQVINGKGEEIVKKSQCTLRNLRLWYKENCRGEEEEEEEEEPVVIVVTDFERCSPIALQDFISALSSYATTVKFVLIFGVATTLHAIHRSLPYDVTSKLNVEVFRIDTQVNILSAVLENIVFSLEHPFRITGRPFQLLTNVFLCYDISVENFFQGYKNCMMQHFHENELAPLCCRPEDLKRRVQQLPATVRSEARRIPSIEKYLRDNGLENLPDEKFEGILLELLEQFHRTVSRLLLVLKCLHSVASTLPNSPIGKQLREFYTKAVCQSRLPESQEYKDSVQLLTILSKQELLRKLDQVLSILSPSEDAELIKVRRTLSEYRARIEEADIETLLKLSQQRSRSAYRVAQLEVIDYLDKLFREHLVNPGHLPAAEIFCFADGQAAHRSIRGSTRAAVHTALTDPRFYLNCECCKLESEEAIRESLPDICIVYKLHLESRKLINMYDWLQAFLVIVDPGNSGEQREVPPQLHARFTRAVAELEFLGFIKSSNTKKDHVRRLD